MKIIGIDPGKSGGIAIMERQEIILAIGLGKLTEQDTFRLLCEHEPATVILEKVGPTPQMGVTSAFSFGGAYYSVRMACIAAGLRMVSVSPQKWQNVLKLPKVGGKVGENSTAKKNRNKARAQELFPQMKITHAIADALLLCEYGRQTEIEKTT